MAGGNSCLGHSNKNENDQINDKGTKSGFDEARENPNSNQPKIITSTVKCLIFERVPMLVALLVPSADSTTRKYTMELRNLLPSDIPKIAVGFLYCLHTHLGQGLIS